MAPVCLPNLILGHCLLSPHPQSHRLSTSHVLLSHLSVFHCLTDISLQGSGPHKPSENTLWHPNHSIFLHRSLPLSSSRTWHTFLITYFICLPDKYPTLLRGQDHVCGSPWVACDVGSFGVCLVTGATRERPPTTLPSFFVLRVWDTATGSPQSMQGRAGQWSALC